VKYLTLPMFPNIIEKFGIRYLSGTVLSFSLRKSALKIFIYKFKHSTHSEREANTRLTLFVVSVFQNRLDEKR